MEDDLKISKIVGDKNIAATQKGVKLYTTLLNKKRSYGLIPSPAEALEIKKSTLQTRNEKQQRLFPKLDFKVWETEEYVNFKISNVNVLHNDFDLWVTFTISYGEVFKFKCEVVVYCDWRTVIKESFGKEHYIKKNLISKISITSQPSNGDFVKTVTLLQKHKGEIFDTAVLFVKKYACIYYDVTVKRLIRIECGKITISYIITMPLTNDFRLRLGSSIIEYVHTSGNCDFGYIDACGSGGWITKCKNCINLKEIECWICFEPILPGGLFVSICDNVHLVHLACCTEKQNFKIPIDKCGVCRQSKHKHNAKTLMGCFFEFFSQYRFFVDAGCFHRSKDLSNILKELLLTKNIQEEVLQMWYNVSYESKTSKEFFKNSVDEFQFYLDDDTI